jgi:amidase
MGTDINIDGIEVNYWVSGSYALMVNALGLPSITIPLGLNDEGLPIGVQVIGKYYSEPQLIHFAKLVESITPGFIKPKEL